MTAPGGSPITTAIAIVHAPILSNIACHRFIEASTVFVLNGCTLNDIAGSQYNSGHAFAVVVPAHPIVRKLDAG